MVFAYPLLPHVRKHGPSGYVHYTSYKDWLRDEFAFRCVYCLVRERWSPIGHAAFGVDHLLPRNAPTHQGLLCAYENLVYSCNRCNSIKSEEILVDPCAEALGQHLRVLPDGVVDGLSPLGTRLALFLRLNDRTQLGTRRYYLKLESYCLDHLDEPEVRWLYEGAFGFPDDLPDLAGLHPPANSRSQGLLDCFYQQRVQGRLPATY